MPAKRNRPLGWGPAHVLERLEAGEAILAITKSAGEAGGVAPRTLYGDVQNWLKRDPEFRDAYKAAMLKSTGRVTNGGAPVTVFGEEEQRRFLEELARNGGKIGPAAQTIPVAEGYVYAKIDPRSKDFAPDFAERVAVLEGTRYGQIREAVLDGAVLDPWLGERVLQAGMPHLHNPKRQVEITGKIEHEHRLSDQALAQIEERQRLWRDARPALPEGVDERRVIDITPAAPLIVEVEA